MGPKQPDVVLNAGADLQAAVEGHPAGTRFVLMPGIYRGQSVVPKRGDWFVGATTGVAVLDGAAAVTSFTRQGAVWVADGPRQAVSDSTGECMPQHPLCTQTQDLYFDGEALEPVTSSGAVVGARWYLDRSRNKIFLGTNPEAHSVAIGETEQAFVGPANDVTIESLTIQHYANRSQEGAISALAANNGQSSRNWKITNCEVRWNHGVGIKGGHNIQITGNHVHHNGQLGIAASGTNILVQDNEIDHNNTAGYEPGWEAGGTKFSRCTRLVVAKNSVHDNRGPGLWTDGYNSKVIYEKNRTNDNWVAGILHEISYDAIIRDNTVENDGYHPSGHTSPWYGAGIVIAASSDVEVYGNTVTNCMNGIVLVQADRGPGFVVKGAEIHNNTITQTTGFAAGAVANSANSDVFTKFDVHFRNNIYRLGRDAAARFHWMNKECSLAEWRAFGNN